MHKKGLRYAGLLLSAILVISAAFVPKYAADTPAQRSVPSADYIVGSEDDGSTVDTSLKSKIASDNLVQLDFTSGTVTDETVNKLLVENNAFYDESCDKFKRNVSLTSGGLRLFNYYNFNQGSILSNDDIKSNAKMQYSLRSDYVAGDIDAIDMVVNVPYQPYESSSANMVNEYLRASFYLWYGKNESGELIGIRISRNKTGFTMCSCKINPQSGEYVYNENVKVASVVGEKIHIYLSYVFNYDDGVYQVCVYAGGSDADGNETIGAKYVPNTASSNVKPFINITERTFAMSCATVNRDKDKFDTYVEKLSIGFDDGYDQETEFQENYKMAINLDEDTISYQDKSYIEAAASKYETLPVREKGLFKRMYLKWQDFLKKISEYEAAGQLDAEFLRAENDYSQITDDLLTTGYRRFYNANSEEAPTRLEKVYDEELGKDVIKLRSRAIFTPKAYTMPYNWQSVSVTYKMKIEGEFYDVNNSWIIYPWYVDSNNYVSITFDINKDSVMRQAMTAYVDGNRIVSTGRLKLDTKIDPRKWCDVSVIMNGNRLVVNISQQGVDDPCTFGHNLPTMRSAFALGGCNGEVSASKVDPETGKTIWYNKNAAVYYADLNMTLEKSSYVPDGVNTEITAYYTGNTEVDGGDIVSVIGEDLYNTVSAVKIARVPDQVNISGTSYLSEIHYDKGSRRSDVADYQFSYYTALDNNLSGNYMSTTAGWDWKDTSILQYTENSLNFAVPSDFERGVYAVRLCGRNSYNEDIILYLNNADLDYYVGDEGTTATPGGQLQIIGKATVLNSENMYVQLRGKGGIYTYYLQDGDTPDGDKRVTVDSKYSVIINLPNSIKKGDYELTVYNGYGDSTCISEPLKVTIGDSPKASWPDYTVNVADLGATGDKNQNATPYFVTALTLLAEHGGGTLYIPAGYFKLMHSLVIPENVTVKGAGMERTYIVIIPLHYDLGELPMYHFAYTGNVSFEEFSILGSRAGRVFGCYATKDTENVHWKNIRYQKWTFSGAPTGSGEGAGSLLYGYTENEVYAMLVSEQRTCQSGFWFYNKNSVKIDNWRADGLDIYSVGPVNLSAPAYYGGLRNGGIMNSKIEVAGSAFFSMTGSNFIYSNNEYNSAGQSVNGDNIYYSHNNYGNIPNNNHEIAVADEGLTYGAERSGVITPFEDDQTGRYYKINKGFNRNVLLGCKILVVSGKGLGQVREIVYNEGNVIQIDNAFEISPTANSNIIISSRQNYFITENYFHDGSSPIGFFGNGMDIIHDNNEYDEMIDIPFWARNSMIIWYLSVTNANFHDPKAIQSTGIGDNTARNALLFHCSSGTDCFRGAVVRDNVFDGYVMEIALPQLYNLKDLIVQDNTFKNVVGRSACAVPNSKSVDGVIYSNNMFYECDNSYSTTVTNGFNKQGSKRLMILGTTLTNRIAGDVNFDGVVTLKDATLIKYYVLGLVELDDDHLAAADVYKDRGTVHVDMKDATTIRKYVLGIIPSLENVDVDSSSYNPPDYSDDSSSDSSSEDTSSGGTSSGDTSSGGTSSGGTSSGGSSSGGTSSGGSSSGGSSSSSSSSGGSSSGGSSSGGNSSTVIIGGDTSSTGSWIGGNW